MQVNLTAQNYQSQFESVIPAIADELQRSNLVMTITRPNKSRDQERKYHAMLGEISNGVQVLGKRYSPEIWKVLLVDEFEQERRAMGEPLGHSAATVPSLDGRRLVTVRPSTRQLSATEASSFTLFRYATALGVWTRRSATPQRAKSRAVYARK